MSFQTYFPCLFAVCLTVISIKSVLTFTGYSCPSPSLATFVAAKACNDSSEYHCLYNGRSKLYESYCFKMEKFPAGSYVLYQGGLNSKGCTDDRYQPTVYLSNQYNSKCIYSKTRCSEEGQVIHDSSFAERDGTCRCDYTQGYDFVTKPRHRCFCIPAEEDCSCYKKRCPKNTTLTPDYQCLETVGLITCAVIKQKYDEPGDNVVVNRQKDFSLPHNTIRHQSGFQRWFLIGVVAGMVLLLFIGCIVVIRSQGMSEEFGQNNNFEDDSNTIDYKLITRNGFQKSIEALKKYRLVVVKGRYGTGKSFMAKQITQRFPDYKTRVMQKEDLSKFINVSPDGQGQIIIFDEVCGMYEDEEGRRKIIKVIETFFVESSNLLIITVGEFHNAFIESLRKMSLAGDGNLIDLDTDFALSKAERLCLFNHYLKQLEAKQGDRSSFLASLLPENVKEEILSTDTYHGFPRLCKTFCSELNNIKLGPNYFKQPPQQLIDEIERIRVATSAKDESSRIQYSILIYILLSIEGCIDIHGIHSELMREIAGSCFGLVFLYNDFIQYLQMKDIPLQRFLKHIGDGKYTMHPSVYQAVLFSFTRFRYFMFKRVVEKCKLEHVLDLYRMPDYEPLPNEIVILCNKEKVKTFCETVSKRMADVSLIDDASAYMVCRYIVKMQYDYLSQQYFAYLQEEIRNYITSKRVHLMLIIFKELVLEAECRNVNTNQFVTVWSALVYNKYGKYSLIADLMQIPVISTTKTFPLAMLGSIVDEYDNNMLTYCILWWKSDSEHPFVMAVSNLLSQSLKNLSFGNLFTHTKEGVSPIDFAAYFGRHHCLQIFLTWHERDAEENLLGRAAFHKLRNQTEELIEMARKGEKKLLVDKIKYNTEICPKVQIGTVIDFEKTHTVLEEFRENLARHHEILNN